MRGCMSKKVTSMIGPIPLSFKQVFQDSNPRDAREALISHLQTLCRSETLRYSIHLNLFVSDLDDPRINLAQQQVLLRMFFSKPEMDRLNQLATLTLRSDYTVPTVFFHRAQLLELIRYATLHCPNTNCHRSPVQNKKSKNRFLKSALLASEIALDRMGSEKDLEVISMRTKREKILRFMRVGSQTALQKIDPARSFGRGKLMFSIYLPNEFPDFLGEFESHTQMTLDQYFSCLFIVLSHYYNIPLNQGSHSRHLIKLNLLFEQIPHMAEMFTRYMKLEAQSIDELQTALLVTNDRGENYNLQGIREKPILYLTEDEAIVIDSILHVEKAMISPLFMLSRKLAERKISLQGHFGDAFEKYVQDILKKMYTKSDENLRIGDELVIEGDEICDACVIEGDSLLLFEIKAVWVRDDKIASPDHTEYLSELRNKYGKEGNAAFQLARAVNRLISGEWALKNHMMQRTKRIYPVLVAYDSSLNAPGYFWFFGSEFRTLIEHDAVLKNSKTLMTKSKWEIAPVTIITIDVLENLEASVKNFKLSDLLRDFFAYCDTNFRDIDDDLSLSEFIRRKYVEKMDLNGSVVKKALETFEESVNMINPDLHNSNTER